MARLLQTSRGDRFAALRVSRDLANRLNRLLGEPVCDEAELARRRAAEARLAQLARDPGASEEPRPQAPVMIYFEKDRNARELARIEELLRAKGISYESFDVAGDEATSAFVAREAHVKADDLPVVFVAGNAVGPYPALVAFEVSGALQKALRGG